MKLFFTKIFKIVLIFVILFLVVDIFIHKKIFPKPTFQISQEEYYKELVNYYVLEANIIEEIIITRREIATKNIPDNLLADFIDYIENDDIYKNINGIDFTIKQYKKYINEEYLKYHNKYNQSLHSNEKTEISEREAIYLGFREEYKFKFSHNLFYNYPLIMNLIWYSFLTAILIGFIMTLLSIFGLIDFLGKIFPFLNE